MSERTRFYGKFRGTVLNNIDPMQKGRIQVMVPDTTGLVPGSWAMPCVPFAGRQSGLYVLPQIGDGVWVEFEQGDLDYPVWVGGFWGSAAEVPVLALAGLPVSPSVVLQTGGQNTLMLSDLPGPTGGILLKSTTGALISITELGITISNGQGATITLLGPAVNINAGALTVI
ncbi:phage baseplate assembly protein V [Massilia sp. TSP1-1-2]|uniref:phage baseplate assembly protein V n=1 Tax=unclassified Massilia TaxID=2609279 RepID=UPI003CE70B7A